MIRDKRNYYRPFEYPQFTEFAEKQQLVHWLKHEVSMSSDIQDWKFNLTEGDKQLVGKILKSFTQAEILVGDYWRKVAEWFPKPEICQMAATFSYFETIHQQAYAYLNESLDLEDFQAFMQDEQAMAKLNYLTDVKGYNLEEIAASLAIFSAFTEGVLIFSSFGILLNYSRFNKLKDVGQIVKYSVRDEQIHSMGGIELFNVLCKENPGLKEKIEEKIKDAGNEVLFLETNFINSAFENNTIEGITKEGMTEFIKFRIHTKLKELGYTSNYTFNKQLLENMSWFYDLTNAQGFGDFFATRVNEYTEQKWNMEDMW